MSTYWYWLWAHFPSKILWNRVAWPCWHINWKGYALGHLHALFLVLSSDLIARYYMLSIKRFNCDDTQRPRNLCLLKFSLFHSESPPIVIVRYEKEDCWVSWVIKLVHLGFHHDELHNTTILDAGWFEVRQLYIGITEICGNLFTLNALLLWDMLIKSKLKASAASLYLHSLIFFCYVITVGSIFKV